MFKFTKAGRAILIGAVALASVAGSGQMAQAAGYYVNRGAYVQVNWWDHLNVRKWPAAYSQKIGALDANSPVWVQRCVVKYNSSDWCKISNGQTSGWVNSKFLQLAELH